MKNIAILGSTGSIGVNTLKIIKNNQGQFRVFALVSNKNYRLLFHQVVEFKPKFVYVHDLKALNKLKKLLDTVKHNTNRLGDIMFTVIAILAFVAGVYAFKDDLNAGYAYSLMGFIVAWLLWMQYVS